MLQQDGLSALGCAPSCDSREGRKRARWRVAAPASGGRAGRGSGAGFGGSQARLRRSRPRGSAPHGLPAGAAPLMSACLRHTARLRRCGARSRAGSLRRHHGASASRGVGLARDATRQGNRRSRVGQARRASGAATLAIQVALRGRSLCRTTLAFQAGRAGRGCPAQAGGNADGYPRTIWWYERVRRSQVRPTSRSRASG